MYKLLFKVVSLSYEIYIIYHIIYYSLYERGYIDNLILTIVLWDKYDYCYPHFIDGKSETKVNYLSQS